MPAPDLQSSALKALALDLYSTGQYESRAEAEAAAACKLYREAAKRQMANAEKPAALIGNDQPFASRGIIMAAADLVTCGDAERE